MDILIDLSVIFVPCILIYCTFQFRLGARLLNFMDRRLRNEKPHATKDDKKPGGVSFLCAWLLSLSLLVGYKRVFEGIDIDASALAAYAIILAVTAGIGLMVARLKYNKVNEQ